jgi:hypothetical protein
VFLYYQFNEDSIPEDFKGKMPLVTELADGLVNRLIYLPDEYSSGSEQSDCSADEELIMESVHAGFTNKHNIPVCSVET